MANSDLQTAVHESGHALVGLHLGVPVLHVTIEPRAGEYAGCCFFTHTLSDEPADVDVAVSAAGALARRVLLGDSQFADLEQHIDCGGEPGEPDSQYIHNRLAEIPEGRRQAFWLACVGRAESILIARLNQLEALAGHLAERRTLGGTEIEDFLETTK